MKIGNINLDFLGHSGFVITSHGGKRIMIDPYHVSSGVDKADLILITHSHFDHCSIEDISRLVKPEAVVVIPADAQSKIGKIEGVDMQIVEVGDELEFGNIKIKVVPAYNLDKDFHPKSEGWFGFVIKMGTPRSLDLGSDQEPGHTRKVLDNVIIYHAGDSDNIPEIKRLTGYGKEGNEFIALLPVSGKYVMDAEEAAEAASLLSPDLAIPMHYGGGVVGDKKDAEKFVGLCKDVGIKAVVLEKI